MLRDHICIYMVKRVATRDIVPLWVRVSLFLYMKILVSGQENIIYEKTMKYHKEWIIGHDKKDYRNSQYFVFVFS